MPFVENKAALCRCCFIRNLANGKIKTRLSLTYTEKSMKLKAINNYCIDAVDLRRAYSVY